MGGDVVLGLAAHAQDLGRTTGARWPPRPVPSDSLSPALDSAGTRLSPALGFSDTGFAGLDSPTAAGYRSAGRERSAAGARGTPPGTCTARRSGRRRRGDGRAAVAHPGPGDRVDRHRGVAVELPGPLNPAMITAAAGDAYAPPPPRLGTIFSIAPRSASTTSATQPDQADALTGLIEALHTEGGVAVRMTAELLGQQQHGHPVGFPSCRYGGDDFRFKFDQVWREKIGAPGISTQLIKDQYGVIRRTDIDAIADSLGPGIRIVYFLPEQRHDDHTVRVEQVERRLVELADRAEPGRADHPDSRRASCQRGEQPRGLPRGHR